MLLWCIFMSKPENPHVFPWCGDLNTCPTINLGMTLRDYFAAAALQGILHEATRDEILDMSKGTKGGAIEAMAAYKWADAMLKERLK